MKTVYRRSLPHLQPSEGTFFVTFRLKDSLPAAVFATYQAERTKRLSAAEGDEKAIYDEQKRLFAVYDAYLDRCMTSHNYLTNPEVASIMAEVMRGRDGQTYQLLAYCIMANHVHLVLDLADVPEKRTKQLFRLIGSMKRYSAKLINRHLQRSGELWQHESYDHLVRNITELKRVISYTLLNPVNAGLVNAWSEWPYSYVAESLAPEFM